MALFTESWRNDLTLFRKAIICNLHPIPVLGEIYTYKTLREYGLDEFTAGFVTTGLRTFGTYTNCFILGNVLANKYL